MEGPRSLGHDMLLGVKVAKSLPSHEVSFVNCYQEMGDMHHQDFRVYVILGRALD